MDDQNYIINIAGNNSKAVDAIIVSTDDNITGYAHRTGNGNFHYYGRPPRRIFAIPASYRYGLTCRTPDWQEGNTTTIDLDPTIILRLKVHIVHAPMGFEVAVQKFWSDYRDTLAIWSMNKFGLTIQGTVISDDTANPALEGLRHYKCNHNDIIAQSLYSQDLDFIHIFYVETVNNLSYAGYVCKHPKPYCILGYNSIPGLLAHELGHAFGLDHPDAKSRLRSSCYSQLRRDLCNTMWAQPDKIGDSFTTGQIIHAHLDQKSAINLACSSRSAILSSTASRSIPVTERISECGDHQMPPIHYDTKFWCTSRNRSLRMVLDAFFESVDNHNNPISPCQTGEDFDWENAIRILTQNEEQIRLLQMLASPDENVEYYSALIHTSGSREFKPIADIRHEIRERAAEILKAIHLYGSGIKDESLLQ